MNPSPLARLVPAVAALVLLGCGGQEPIAPAAQVMGAAAPGGQLATPSNVKVAIGSDGAIVVTWTDNSNNESRFDVFRSPYGSPTDGYSLVGTAAANATSYRDTDVVSPFDYCYLVRATKVKGNSSSVSAPSASACVLAPLVVPSNVTATATSDHAITVAWQDGNADEWGFEVFRVQGGSLTLVARTGASVTSVVDTGLLPSTTYCYAVRAFRGSLNVSPFAPSTCAQTFVLAPTVASITLVRPFASSAVDVLWIDGSASLLETARVYRSIDGGATWVLVETVAGGAGWSFSDVDLQSERAVCYQVVNSTAAGTAAPSNTMCTTPPAAPTALTATTVDAATTDLAWRDESAVEDGYEVRAVIGGCGGDDGNGYWCDYQEAILAVLPAGTTGYRATFPDAQFWNVYAMKDGGYGSAASVPAPSATPAALRATVPGGRLKARRGLAALAASSRTR